MSPDPFVLVGNKLYEILGRRRFDADPLARAATLAGKRILVTGAGGSIGSALCELLARVSPASLTMLDLHENSLFHLRQQLNQAFPTQPLHYVLADVRDRRRVRSLLADARPEVIFHMAAYKHVPLAEELPSEFVAVNVLGTLRLIQEAQMAGVSKIVYPSTDKAVRPPGVYGATKRSAELIVKAAALSYSETQINAVRLVNVLGAAGSVIETFARQISAGHAVTVTDVRMTRYWISMDEALLLLVTAAVDQSSGRTFLLDLGEPVNVAMVAERLWTLLRPEGEPLRIEYCGSRPGERLAEELTYPHEELIGSDFPDVMQVRDSHRSPKLEEISAAVDRLARAVDECDDRLREYLFAFVEQRTI